MTQTSIDRATLGDPRWRELTEEVDQLAEQTGWGLRQLRLLIAQRRYEEARQRLDRLHWHAAIKMRPRPVRRDSGSGSGSTVPNETVEPTQARLLVSGSTSANAEVELVEVVVP
jgi:hypothetical protein